MSVHFVGHNMYVRIRIRIPYRLQHERHDDVLVTVLGSNVLYEACVIDKQIRICLAPARTHPLSSPVYHPGQTHIYSYVLSNVPYTLECNTSCSWVLRVCMYAQRVLL